MISYLKMQDLGHSFHSQKYELTISPCSWTGTSQKYVISPEYYPWNPSNGNLWISASSKTPRSAKHTVRCTSKNEYVSWKFQIKLWNERRVRPKPFEDLMNFGIQWVPKISALLREQDNILLPEEEAIVLEEEYLLAQTRTLICGIHIIHWFVRFSNGFGHNSPLVP